MLADDHCLIHLNPTADGVVIPDHLRKEPTVSLKLSHYFAGSVQLREDRVEAELRFGATAFSCVFPYASIWAVSSVDGHLTVWEDRALHPSFPQMLRDSFAASVPSIKKVPVLTAVKKMEPALALQVAESSSKEIPELKTVKQDPNSQTDAQKNTKKSSQACWPMITV